MTARRNHESHNIIVIALRLRGELTLAVVCFSGTAGIVSDFTGTDRGVLVEFYFLEGHYLMIFAFELRKCAF